MSLFNFLISDVLASDGAAAAADAAPQAGFASFIPLILIFVIFYFLLIRPQQKKMKEHQALVDALKSGDKVITNGGIYGTVKSVNKEENSVELEIAKDVVIKVSKPSVSDLNNKEITKKK